MDRNLVYPGSIPLDTDILSLNRDAMIALGYLAQATLGSGTVVDGLGCAPAAAGLAVTIAPGAITQLTAVDANAFGSLGTDGDPLLKMGINTEPTTLALTAPTTAGQSVAYLIQATLQESDVNPVVLPYYNAANPTQPFAGQNNSGQAQPTRRVQLVGLAAKAGAAAPTGTQAAPPVDTGYVGLYVVTLGAGQVTVAAGNIAALPGAPFVPFKLPGLRPGFASGTQSFAASGTFIVPAGVTLVEAEIWGGGAGSYASVSGMPSGGGAAGGYARRRVPVTPGQAVPVTIGPGGQGGTTGGQPAGPGGSSSFGSYVSATGGSLNYLATPTSPINGATPSGTGQGGEINLSGSCGQAGAGIWGGLGGAAPFGGAQNSGTTGNAGLFPGGGAAGAGTGPGIAGTNAYNGAAGAPGFVFVRW